MIKLKTWHIVLLAIIFLLLLIWGLFSDSIKKLWKPKASAQIITSTKPEEKPQLDFNKVLKKGVYNSEEVKLLQTWLGGLDVDGDFGDLTEEALRARIHFSETTLANFQQLIASEADSEPMMQNWQNSSDDPMGAYITNPFNWFM